ncbi:DUF2779 domain-containing protein [Helicobacter pametensis]|uniref:DUF2779 domain-containing protein n=1 Tax=Helicobacter pametensis TaxID=95149 RepID=UPI00048817A9|nr:DUF2779 domain-containing protein [Helicobacter pametensis]
MFSKSLYTRGLQCPKSLWLKKNKPEVLSIPDDSRLAVFDNGDRIGDLARSLFPSGKEIRFDGGSFDEKIAQTKEWLEDGESVIYEATFQYDGVLVMVDILCIRDDGLHLYEVKSSTSLKDVYLQDVSIQYYVLSGLGYEIKSANVVHIDSEYTRGEELEIEKLFKIQDVSEIVRENQQAIPQRLQDFREMLRGNEPQIQIGIQCLNPYECDGCHYCWSEQRKIPDYSVFNLARLPWKKRFELYYEGFVRLEEIESLDGFSKGQRLQILSQKDPQIHIDREKIAEFLSMLRYPIYHLDFETFQQSIPQWKGISPYEQIPFQYSLHIEYEDGRLEHREFLAQEGEDPREEMARKLLEDIPQDVMVMAYNASFERGVIHRLADEFPQYSSLRQIASNIIDLMIPFANKDYYHPKMQGSHSIKKVLPALVPQMDQAYQNLELVHHGGEAMEVFPRLHLMDEELKHKYKKALLEYCKLDTLAMVEILRELRRAIKTE